MLLLPPPEEQYLCVEGHRLLCEAVCGHMFTREAVSVSGLKHLGLEVAAAWDERDYKDGIGRRRKQRCHCLEETWHQRSVLWIHHI